MGDPMRNRRREQANRFNARSPLAYYEAARPTKLQKQRRERGSANSAIERAGTSIREQARHLDQNHDLARGILNTLVQNIAGPTGISIEPQPRTASGEIHEDFAREILRKFRNWSEFPEVTHRHDFASAQRLAVRSWLRDGEMFANHLSGSIPGLNHGTLVPYSFELLESDMVPMDLHSTNPVVVAGFGLNEWMQRVNYYVLKTHPGDGISDAKPVNAENITHLALTDRIQQMRGVSIFASILSRLDDIKDYEESERIAAKVAASMAAYIIKGTPDRYEQELDSDGDPIARDMRFRPGMVFDDLREGEQIGTIDTQRPSAQLEPHRNGQLRAVAAGSMASYSSISKNYDGSYSSQRQELVEQYGAYGVLASEFIGQFVRPIYKRFLLAAQAGGELLIPQGIDPESMDDALFIPPQMPWIDPAKEATALEKLEQNTFASGPEIIRKRGMNPSDVLEQEALWQKKKRDKQLNNDDASNETEGGSDAGTATLRSA